MTLGAVGVVGAVLAQARSVLPSRPRQGGVADRPLSVSVVIPVRDDAAALDRCLRLLAAQEVAPAEVIVVDNGSTDAGAAVARAHGARVVLEPQVGIPPAAAAGYDAARGDVIARCDADSAPPPQWVGRIVTVMAGDETLDAVTGTGRFYDLPPVLAHLAGALYLGAYYTLVHAALGHTTLWGSNMALRRRTWQAVRDRVHREDAELHDDMDLAFALGPTRRVRLDRRLRVGVSARSLRGAHQLRRRLRRAVRTIEVNWADAPPWERWARRWSCRPGNSGLAAHYRLVTENPEGSQRRAVYP